MLAAAQHLRRKQVRGSGIASRQVLGSLLAPRRGLQRLHRFGLKAMADHPCRDAAHHRIGRQILGHHLRLIRRAVERHHERPAIVLGERPARWVHTVAMPPNSRSSFQVTIQASRCSLGDATGRSLGWTQWVVPGQGRARIVPRAASGFGAPA